MPPSSISVRSRAAMLGWAVLASGLGAQAGAAADVTGVWIDHTGKGAVEIAPCADKMCGRVVWLENPNHKSKSGQAICGAQILGDLRRAGNGQWEAGWIFNPEDEERFSAEIKLKSADTLLVTGYLGIKWLGETFTWKRAPPNQQRCSARAS